MDSRKIRVNFHHEDQCSIVRILGDPKKADLFPDGLKNTLTREDTKDFGFWKNGLIKNPRGQEF
ncbi:MAG: hypothetical protein K940chlam7_01531 [Chlamydiae bacterium]|nr:hypothetical protein [Chlamydiota bacterium]